MASRPALPRPVSAALLWIPALFLLLPFAADAAAEAYNCYCVTNGACTYDSTISDSSVGAAGGQCETLCQKNGRESCLTTLASVDPGHTAGAGIDAKGGVDGTAKPQAAPSGPVKLQNPLSAATVPQLVANILSTAVGMVGALALLMFIYGGLRWLTSGGEPAKIQAGKDAMKWAAIGLVVIFSSYALVTFAFKALTG